MNATIAFSQAIGSYYVNRYKTRKQSLKLLGITYYLSKFMGKAIVWLRTTRLKKASSRLSKFIRVYVKTWLAKR